jgi:hypothetical protein
MAPGKEYLQQAWARAKELIPLWLFDQIHAQALPSSGGLSSRKGPGHTALEVSALANGGVDVFAALADDDLLAMIESIKGWRATALKRGLDVYAYDRSLGLIMQEAMDRCLKFNAKSSLCESVTERCTLADRLSLLPDEIDMQASVGMVSGGLVELDPRTVDEGLKTIEHTVRTVVGEWPRTDEPVAVYDVILRKSQSIACHVDEPEPQHGATLSLAPVSKEALQKRSQDEERRLIYYVVAEPDVEDTYGDIIDRKTIEEACHSYAGSWQVKLEHGKDQGLNLDGSLPDDITGDATVVESYIAPCQITAFLGSPIDAPVTQGSWVACIHYDQKLWDYLKNKPHGISWGGLARRAK